MSPNAQASRLERAEAEPLAKMFSMRISATEGRALDFVAAVRDVHPASGLLREMSFGEVVAEYRRLVSIVREEEA